MKHFKLFLTCLLLTALGVGNAWGGTPDYTLDATSSDNKGSNNGYASSCDVTVDDITWNVTGNATMNPWRIGGKSLSKADRAVYSKTAYGYAVDSIKLEIGAASSVTINSIKLIHSTSADFSSATTIDAGGTSASTTYTFKPSSGFAKDSYFKFVFNVTIGSSNKFIEFKKVEIYNHPSGGGGSTETTVSVTGVTLSETSKTLTAGETFDLTATVAPSNATTKTVTWSSDKESVATVDATGKVTAVAEGTANITVKTTDGDKTATCAVTVNPFTPAAGTYDIVPNNALWGTSYSGTFSTSANSLNLTGTAKGVSFTMKNGTSTSGYINDTQTRCYNGYTLKISAPNGFEITKIVITEKDKNSDPTANVGSYDDATNTWTGNAADVTLTYSGTSGLNSLAITYAVGKTLTGIEVEGTNTNLWKNGTFNTDGVTVKAVWDDNSKTTVASSDCYFSGYNMATAGSQTISVSYNSKSTTYSAVIKTIANTAETAYTTAEAIALIDANNDLTTEVYVKGTVSKVDSYNENFHSITYWLDNNAFEIYGGLAKTGETFSSINDIVKDAEVVVKGKITKFGSTYEMALNSVLVSYVAPPSALETATISLSTYKSKLALGDADDVITITYNGNGTLSAVSSETSVATVSLEGTTLTVHPVAAGSTVITVSAPETAEFTDAKKHYTLTVENALAAAALPFTFDGGVATIDPANGIKQNGLGSDYAASPKLKFDGAGDEVIVYIADVAVQLSYTVKGNGNNGESWAGTFDVLESADNVSYTSLASHTDLGDAAIKTHDMASTTRYIKFVYTTKTTGNVALGDIKVIATTPKETPTFSVANVAIETGTSKTIAVTTNSTGAVTYQIAAADAEKLTIESGVVSSSTIGVYTVTANLAEDETYDAASTTFKVTVTAPDPVAELPFSFDGGVGDIATTAGMKHSGIGSDYSTSPKLKFNDQGDNVVIKYSSMALNVTYKIKGNSTSGTYAFDVMESADGTTYTTVHSHNSIADAATSYTDKLKVDSRYVKFVYTTKANGNVALGAISISNEKANAELAFENSSYRFMTTASDKVVVATSAKGSTGSITYSCEDANLTVNASTGAITCTTVGAYTVKATIAETEDFKPSTVSCTIKVVEPATPNSIIVAEVETGDGNKYFAMTNTAGDKYITSVEIQKFGDMYVVSEANYNAVLYQTTTADGKTTIVNIANQYLQATAAKNVSFTDNEYQWTNDGEKLTASTSSYGTLQYYTGSPRFTTYGSKVGQYATIVSLDNVIKSNGTVAERSFSNGAMGTHCYPFTIKAGEYTGAAFYVPAYRLGTSKLYWDEVTGDIEAGKPYLVVPEEGSEKMTYVKQADSESAPVAVDYGMIGNFTAPYAMITANAGNYIVYNNQFRLAGEYVAVGQYRAYIHLEDVVDHVVSEAPGRRRISMSNAEAEVATGLDEMAASKNAQKIMLNGQIFILRDNRIFTPSGVLVK